MIPILQEITVNKKLTQPLRQKLEKHSIVSKNERKCNELLAKPKGILVSSYGFEVLFGKDTEICRSLPKFDIK